MDRIKEILDILYAIELLEYHDMNWLSSDIRQRSIEKCELLQEAREKLAKERGSVVRPVAID